MAHENKHNGLRGQTDLWLTIEKNDSGTMKVYDVVAGSDTFVVWDTADQDDYDIAFVENSPGVYSNTFPADITAGFYDRKVRKGSKTDADTTHEIVGGDTVYWDGTNIITGNTQDIIDRLDADISTNSATTPYQIIKHKKGDPATVYTTKEIFDIADGDIVDTTTPVAKMEEV